MVANLEVICVITILLQCFYLQNIDFMYNLQEISDRVNTNTNKNNSLLESVSGDQRTGFNLNFFKYQVSNKPVLQNWFSKN